MKLKLLTLKSVFILMCMLLVQPAVWAQEITIKESSITLVKLFKEIERQSDFLFTYVDSDVKDINVKVDVKQAGVGEVLKEAFSGTSLAYEIIGRNITITKVKPKAQASNEPVTVKGLVTDDKGVSLPMVSVLVKGTTVGVLSALDGTYSITLPAGTKDPVLRFSFIGFVDKDEAVGSRSVVNTSLAEAVNKLDEVVVVGYGSVKKSDATGAVDVIKSSDFNKGNVSSPEMLFNGHIAGVQVAPNSGQPGANVSVRIRGVNSISASSEPLYVIDGVPIDNARSAANVGGDAALSNVTLNPLSMIAASDIESMTVLKDASATAIYGSRGANGVILIKTKSGKNGMTSVSYAGSLGVSTVSKKIELLNADQYRSFVPNAKAGVSTDWQDEIFRSALIQNHNVSFSSGNANTSYMASLSASDQNGIIITTGLKRYTARLNVIHKMFDERLVLTMNVNNTKYKMNNLLEQQTSGADGGIINNALKGDPTQAVYLPDGSFNEYSKSVRNPVAMAKQITDITNGDRFIGNADATFFFIPKTLSVKTNIAYDVDNTMRQAYQPIASVVAQGIGGRALLENNKYSNHLLETYLTFNKTFNQHHNLNVMGGYSWQEFDSYTSSTVAQGFINDLLGADNISGAEYQTAVNNREINRLISFFGRVNYSFMDKYLFTATIRQDGSSRFGANNRWATFPSTALAWKIKQEDFLKDVAAITDLKLRVGYGVTGNQEIGNFKYNQTYSINSEAGTYFGDKFYSPYNISGIANPNLKWEQTAQLNFGLDYGFLNNRVKGSIDVYRKNTTNLLLTVDAIQPAVSRTYLDNVGSMTNKGVEFTIDAAICTGERFSWNSSFNVSYNKNTITELYNGKDIIYGIVSGAGASGNTQILRVGKPLGSFYGQRFIGIYKGTKINDKGEEVPYAEEIFASPDREIIGSALPDYTLGFINNFSYANFDLSVVLRSALGGEVYNNTRAEVSQGSRLPGQNTNMEGAEYHAAGGGGIVYSSSRWVENASFLRLDNITLGYNFKSLPAVFKAARLYATAQNLFVIAGYKGYDPEVNNQSGSNGVNSIGIDYCSYPQARTFTIGLNVNF